MEAKSFYATYHANNELCKIDQMLIDEVLKENPESVFDFGTGTGKNLKRIMELNHKVNVCGLDMSFINIIHARAQNNLPFLIIGDEWFLCRLRNFDVVITCSVLCHIKNISMIINDLKEIAKKSIIIAETTDNGGEFYYAHDYESFGFVDLGLRSYSSGNNCNYRIYKYEKQYTWNGVSAES
jgi:2-polyprenyl-3-methyl-5-hydroxy-6-metoxy-1,4-benzoquinol methylase